MTIAACYVSDEGIVLGADSTAMTLVRDPEGQTAPRYYNFAQKIFEVGDPGSTAAIAFWGLGSMGEKSYRTFIAEMADNAKRTNLRSMDELATLASSLFWTEYVRAFGDSMERVRELDRKSGSRTEPEQDEWDWLQRNLSGGFCVGGRWGESRLVSAWELTFDPSMREAPAPKQISRFTPKYWGSPALIYRLTLGIDASLLQGIVESGKWVGTSEELTNLVLKGSLRQPRDLPIREAIDWIFSSIYVTIKAVKFSHLLPACGGPIEIAVITSDRPFRWVRHKPLDLAIANF